MDDNILRQRLSKKRCVILGSSPNPHISNDVLDEDALLICVKGSGWGAKQLNLPDPFITFELDWNYLRFLKSNVLKNLKSEIVIHILQREFMNYGGVLDVETSIFFETDEEVLHNYGVGQFEMQYFRRLSFHTMLKTLLRAARWNPSRWSDVERSLNKDNDPVEMDLFMQWRCHSTAVLAAGFCLAYGAKEVILSGISFTETGHSFFANEKKQKEEADAWPRCHVPADRMVLRRLKRFNQPIKTTEPDVAEQTGIELIPAPERNFNES